MRLEWGGWNNEQNTPESCRGIAVCRLWGTAGRNSSYFRGAGKREEIRPLDGNSALHLLPSRPIGGAWGSNDAQNTQIHGIGIIGEYPGKDLRMNTIILPWPAKELSPNARCHWAAKAKAARAARTAAGWITMAAKIRVDVGDNGTVTLKITFQPPDKRKRDLDGMLSSNKSALDGIADALGINDCRFRFALEIGDPVRGGRVIVRIE